MKANEWNPIESVASLKRMALEPTNAMDILRCASENLKNGFVFDFSSKKKCFKITGYGTNNLAFSKQTYIYLKDSIFISNCSVEPKQLSIPTRNSIYIVIFMLTFFVNLIRALHFSISNIRCRNLLN